MEQQFINNLLAFVIGGMIITAVLTTFVGIIMYIAQELTITWMHEPNGICPVQAEGWFIGYYFYFRSRYETGKIQFCKTIQDWDNGYITKEYVVYRSDDAYVAGYIKHSKARRLIYWGCFKFLINRIIRNIKDAVK